MESVPLSSRILHSLPDSSEGIMAAVDPGRHSVTRARDLIKRHLPPRFIFNMLKSRFKEDQFSTNSMVAFTFPFMPDAEQDNNNRSCCYPIRVDFWLEFELIIYLSCKDSIQKTQSINRPVLFPCRIIIFTKIVIIENITFFQTDYRT